MNKNLYVILLENDKYYVYCTDSTVHNRIMIESIFISKFVQKYNPKEIIETFWNIDEFDIDKTVKKYMAKYGIDNVRGGSYQSITLSNCQSRGELNFISSSYRDNNLHTEEKKRYFIYSEIFNIATIHNSSIFALKPDIKELNEYKKKYNDQLNKYHVIKDKIQDMSFFRCKNSSYMIEKEFIGRINFFKSYILSRKFETEDKPDPDMIEMYRQILPYFKHFASIIQKDDTDKFTDFLDENINMVFLSHPEFIFDRIIYLSKYNLEYNRKILNNDYINDAVELCKAYEGICYWILNRIDEYNFDLTYIPKNIEWKTEMINYFVELQQ